MTSSLVGSEMCIRDSGGGEKPFSDPFREYQELDSRLGERLEQAAKDKACLLYTSDAADDM
eukprot:10043909-Prorocentrum_lima.AAC.1